MSFIDIIACFFACHVFLDSMACLFVCRVFLNSMACLSLCHSIVPNCSSVTAETVAHGGPLLLYECVTPSHGSKHVMCCGTAHCCMAVSMSCVVVLLVFLPSSSGVAASPLGIPE
jgi:hypothetical protein